MASENENDMNHGEYGHEDGAEGSEPMSRIDEMKMRVAKRLERNAPARREGYEKRTRPREDGDGEGSHPRRFDGGRERPHRESRDFRNHGDSREPRYSRDGGRPYGNRDFDGRRDGFGGRRFDGDQSRRPPRDRDGDRFGGPRGEGRGEGRDFRGHGNGNGRFDGPRGRDGGFERRGWRDGPHNGRRDWRDGPRGFQEGNRRPASHGAPNESEEWDAWSDSQAAQPSLNINPTPNSNPNPGKEFRGGGEAPRRFRNDFGQGGDFGSTGPRGDGRSRGHHDGEGARGGFERPWREGGRDFRRPRGDGFDRPRRFDGERQGYRQDRPWRDDRRGRGDGYGSRDSRDFRGPRDGYGRNGGDFRGGRRGADDRDGRYGQDGRDFRRQRPDRGNDGRGGRFVGRDEFFERKHGFTPRGDDGFRPRGGDRPHGRFGSEGGYQRRDGGRHDRDRGDFHGDRWNGGDRRRDGDRDRFDRRGQGRDGDFRDRRFKERDRLGRDHDDFAPRPKPEHVRPTTRISDLAPDEPIRLNKMLTAKGMCSRREADGFIEKGMVRVNGEVAHVGQKVTIQDLIEFDEEVGKLLERKVTLIYHKPVNVLSHQSDKQRDTAKSRISMENYLLVSKDDPEAADEFVKKHGEITEAQALFIKALENNPLIKNGLAPAGRLDYDSRGLLVLTQDGQTAKLLISEMSEVDKEYEVKVEGEIEEWKLEKLRHGLMLDGEYLKDAIVEKIDDDTLQFILMEGKKRQIRRMCEAVDLDVVDLKRVRMGKIELAPLEEDGWRFLRDDEHF